MREALIEKKILITGGAGSIGSALTREMLKHNPKTIRIFDISENEMFKVQKDFGGEGKLRFLMGDIRDMSRLRMAMEGIDIVVHLAAMKHVYACEYNPFEAVKTNIDGLQNVINASRDENIEKVIFASTDKAASPCSVMGITKLLGEKLISLANYYKGNKKTLFASVRFGNVIGTNGSMMPLFKKQITTGGPLTITDEQMTRFVITMNEAVQLIYSAIRFARGGETFVWKMRTLKVTDFANAMIRKHSSGKNIEMSIIGKGKGEKMHEDIISEEELSRTVELNNLYIVCPLIDHLQIDRKYEKMKPIENPIISSDKGVHMSREDIEKLLENLEVKNAESLTY